MNAWRCDWQPDEYQPAEEGWYCAGRMCARFDGLNCTHDRIERHGYPKTVRETDPDSETAGGTDPQEETT